LYRVTVQDSAGSVKAVAAPCTERLDMEYGGFDAVLDHLSSAHKKIKRQKAKGKKAKVKIGE
jgi:hypothetical protein